MQEYITDCIRVAKKGKVSKASLNNPQAVEVIRKTPYLFMASAVADYRAKYPQNGKLKKEMLGDEWNLELTKNNDILKSLDKDGIITVGFKAEKDENKALDNAKRALKDKNIDAICLNILTKNNNFGSDYNKVTFITKDSIKEISLKPKINVAFDILEFSKELEK
jgi:phosphopantothenoylcysteine decarboxylase/phosphopantothenate--cysteine ligase